MSTDGTAPGPKATEAGVSAAPSTSASSSSAELAVSPIRSPREGAEPGSDGRWGETVNEPVDVDDALSEYEE